MGERWSLRLRFALFFVGLATGAIAFLAAALWLGHAKYGGPAEGYVIAGLVASFGIAGLAAWVGYLFDENVARPILALASDLDTRARTDVDTMIDTAPARYLGALAPAARAAHDALARTRAKQSEAIAAQTRNLEREKALLAALLRDLSEAALVLNGDGRVLLYNRMAQSLLPGIGLDRDIAGFLRLDPLQHAMARLAAGRERGKAQAERFMTASCDGTRFLLGRVNAVDIDAAPLGHVVILHDASEDLRSHGEQDHLFHELLEQLRRTSSALGPLLDALDAAEPGSDARKTFTTAAQAELNRLHEALRRGTAVHSEISARHWPMAQVAAQDILDAVTAHTDGQITARPSNDFLHCDGFAISSLLKTVTSELLARAGCHALRLESTPRDGELWLQVTWSGPALPDGELDRWLHRPLSEAYGAYTGRDALEAHRTEIWPASNEGAASIVLPLQLSGPPALAPGDPRPEFYDFDLPAQDLSCDLASRPLKSLSFIVFDTETTGLSPRNGDEIVQIAGLRVVNGRILTGEAFDSLVNPGRPIPPASTKVHGITDAMVADAPDIKAAGRAFFDYCDGAILIAHNAPFDIAFLRLKEPAIGREFRQPYLCTVLLSAALFGHTGNHTLDALAQRFGIEIPEKLRHTALGDATATAEIFIRMLDVMEGAGIVTLQDALDASQQMRRIRRAQDY